MFKYSKHLSNYVSFSECTGTVTSSFGFKKLMEMLSFDIRLSFKTIYLNTTN